MESLRADGLAIVPFDELIDDRGLWAELAADAQNFAAVAEQHARQPREPAPGQGDQPKKAKKRAKRAAQNRARKTRKDDFILRATNIGDPRPPEVLLRYALSDQLLGIANAYLGADSKLVYVDKWYTRPIPEQATRTKSQRWHRDHMDHIVKVFTYFSDVDAEAGALEYVRGSAAGGPYGELWPWHGDNHYPPDGELERLVPGSAIQAAEGPSGSVVICDTGGFHRGGFCRRPRVTANFSYITPAWAASGVPRRFEVDGEMLAGLPPVARSALS